jgi:hypothetical protein
MKSSYLRIIPPRPKLGSPKAHLTKDGPIQSRSGRTATGSSRAHPLQAVAWQHNKDGLGGFLFYLPLNQPQACIKPWVEPPSNTKTWENTTQRRHNVASREKSSIHILAL